jgi:steroid delta-isomerase-like uncharacterized protein
MPQSDDPIAVVRDNIEAFNQGDKERFRAQLAPDAVYREYATGREVHGAGEVTDVAFAWRDAFPDARGEITNVFASGDQVTLQITWTGTQTGALVSPSGTIPPTGKQVSIPAVEVITIRDGKPAATDHYFDLLTMLVQLGVAPVGQPA